MSAGLQPNLDNLLNPLTPEQLAGLKAQVMQEPLLRQALEKAKEAGINVDDSIAELDDQMTKAKKLLAVYGS